MGIRSLLRKVFGRDREAEHDAVPSTPSVPPQAERTVPQDEPSAAPTPEEVAAELVAASFDHPKPTIPPARTDSPTTPRPEKSEPAPAQDTTPDKAAEPAKDAEPAEDAESQRAKAQEPEPTKDAEPQDVEAKEPEPDQNAAPQDAKAQEPEPGQDAEPQDANTQEPEPAEPVTTSTAPQGDDLQDATGADSTDTPAPAEPEAQAEPATTSTEPQDAKVQEPEPCQEAEPQDAKAQEPEPQQDAAPVATSAEPQDAEPAQDAEPQAAEAHEPAPDKDAAPQEPAAQEPAPVQDAEPQAAEVQEPEPDQNATPQDVKAAEPEPDQDVTPQDVKAQEPAPDQDADPQEPAAQAEPGPGQGVEAPGADPRDAEVLVDASAAGEPAPRDAGAEGVDGAEGAGGGAEPVHAEERQDGAPLGDGAPAVALRDVKRTAPDSVVEAYKAAGAALRKRGLQGARAAVYLVLDRSGSMRPYYKDGSAQRLGEQALALAAHLDEDATVPVVFFSTEVDGTGDLTLADAEGRIDALHAGLGRMGRTNYDRAIHEVLAHHGKAHPDRPALVIFQTDGAPESKTAATQALAEAAATGRPVFWQFVAFGEEDGKAFDYLRRLDVDNAAFFHAGPTPADIPHARFYRELLAAWPA
ncbi:VWA domain-containing protein [Streptomyces sp. NPDC050585]|uniref:VWA domain-containing protein n=1 Tax=Streptomyces sp. NPDC050585 TaxID=3365632 RepID=UPI003788EDAC